MRSTKGALITLLAALAASAAASLAQTGGDPRTQTPGKGIADCPTINVNCPSDFAKPGEPVTFTASVTGGDPSVTPTYNWTVSAGTISSGQGTSSVTVDTTSLPRNCPSLTATVEVGGYDRSCVSTMSCTNLVCCLTVSRKIDEYGNIRYGDERARLDNYAIELQNDPTAQGYVICYGGRRSAPSDARRRCERARNYLGNLRRISADRIVTVEGGYREEPTVELWIVSAGATPPQPSPTVDPSEVKAPAPPRRVRRRVRR